MLNKEISNPIVSSGLLTKSHYANSINDMKNNISLQAGDFVITLGYYQPNDGGGGSYEIIDDVSLVEDYGMFHTLANGLKAKLIYDGKINIKQYGAKDNLTFDSTRCLLSCVLKFKNILVPKGKFFFNLSAPLIIDDALLNGEIGAEIHLAGEPLIVTNSGKIQNVKIIVANDYTKEVIVSGDYNGSFYSFNKIKIIDVEITTKTNSAGLHKGICINAITKGGWDFYIDDVTIKNPSEGLTVYCEESWITRGKISNVLVTRPKIHGIKLLQAMKNTTAFNVQLSFITMDHCTVQLLGSVSNCRGFIIGTQHCTYSNLLVFRDTSSEGNYGLELADNIYQKANAIVIPVNKGCGGNVFSDCVFEGGILLNNLRNLNTFTNCFDFDKNTMLDNQKVNILSNRITPSVNAAVIKNSTSTMLTYDGVSQSIKITSSNPLSTGHDFKIVLDTLKTVIKDNGNRFTIMIYYKNGDVSLNNTSYSQSIGANKINSSVFTHGEYKVLYGLFDLDISVNRLEFSVYMTQAVVVNEPVIAGIIIVPNTSLIHDLHYFKELSYL